MSRTLEELEPSSSSSGRKRGASADIRPAVRPSGSLPVKVITLPYYEYNEFALISGTGLERPKERGYNEKIVASIEKQLTRVLNGYPLSETVLDPIREEANKSNGFHYDVILKKVEDLLPDGVLTHDSCANDIPLLMQLLLNTCSNVDANYRSTLEEVTEELTSIEGTQGIVSLLPVLVICNVRLRVDLDATNDVDWLSRINRLFPNLLPVLIQSQTVPEVGYPSDANLGRIGKTESEQAQFVEDTSVVDAQLGSYLQKLKNQEFVPEQKRTRLEQIFATPCAKRPPPINPNLSRNDAYWLIRNSVYACKTIRWEREQLYRSDQELYARTRAANPKKQWQEYTFHPLEPVDSLPAVDELPLVRARYFATNPLIVRVLGGYIIDTEDTQRAFAGMREFIEENYGIYTPYVQRIATTELNTSEWFGMQSHQAGTDVTEIISEYLPESRTVERLQDYTKEEENATRVHIKKKTDTQPAPPSLHTY
jgi:hypothetical protein